MQTQTLDADLNEFAGVEAEQLLTDEPQWMAAPEVRPLVMPPEVAKAVIAVTRNVKSLAKDDTNLFGKYKYVSVDAFYASIGPMMADAGLLMVSNEVEVETVQRAATWLAIKYDLMLYHESGAMYGPVRRHIVVQATGPQAFGSAASYIEKYFLRGLFRVPTGEQDADADRQDDLPAQKPASPRHAGAFSRNQPPPDPIPPPAPAPVAPQPPPPSGNGAAAAARPAPPPIRAAGTLREKIAQRGEARRQTVETQLAEGMKSVEAEEGERKNTLVKWGMDVGNENGWVGLVAWWDQLPRDDRAIVHPEMERIKANARKADEASQTR